VSAGNNPSVGICVTLSDNQVCNTQFQAFSGIYVILAKKPITLKYKWAGMRLIMAVKAFCSIGVRCPVDYMVFTVIGP
jgi:hypothetical protein